ncbi:MAG: hypothetical protein WDO73_06095 [Ignavibacteriota bacterium]
MKSGTTFKKRQKELARMEKQRDKQAKRLQRKADKAAGIVVDDMGEPVGDLSEPESESESESESEDTLDSPAGAETSV